MSRKAVCIVVGDSKLEDLLQSELKSRNQESMTPSEWRFAGKPPISSAFFCQEACFKEPRKTLNDIDTFHDQWSRLVEIEVKRTVENCLEFLPHLKQASLDSHRPSSLVFLGSKMVRSPNSPQQVVSSMVKKAMAIFCGSMFFEHRANGLRFSAINPSPDVSHAAIVSAMVFVALEAGPTCNMESIDLASVRAGPQLSLAQNSRPGCAIITGASRGIGKCIAIRLAKEFKLPIVLLGRDPAALQATFEECAKHVGEKMVRRYSLELTGGNEDKLALCIGDAGREFGKIQCLVCSAGFNRRATAASQVEGGGFKFANPMFWKEMMEVNYGSAISATSYSLPFMVNQPGGPSIFYIGSRTVRLGNSPGQQSYVASKMAIAGFAASVQNEVKAFGVRVVCLNVGLVSTELGTRAPKKGTFVPVEGRLQIQPEDLADAVSFTLRSDVNISPQTFDICGMNEEYLDKSGGALKMSSL